MMDKVTPEDVMRATQKTIVAIGELIDLTRKLPASDARALAVARTQFETALLWIATAADGGGVIDV